MINLLKDLSNYISLIDQFEPSCPNYESAILIFEEFFGFLPPLAELNEPIDAYLIFMLCPLKYACGTKKSNWKFSLQDNLCNLCSTGS